MQRLIILSLTILSTFRSCNPQQDTTTKQLLADSITKIEMKLSAFGVESDNFPSIEVFIDFVNDSSLCKKSYDNPTYKQSTYKLSKDELKSIRQLLQTTDLDKLKKDYRISKTDQPTSVTTIYKGQKIYVINDYGLDGDYPLQKLYKTIYKY